MVAGGEGKRRALGESRRDRMRAATVQEITATARRILVEQGPDAVTLRAIAREMGMTAPGLYRYFDSHAGLLRHVVGDVFGDLTADLHKALATVPEGEEQPALVLNTLIEAVRPTGWLGVVGLYVTKDPGAPSDEASRGELMFNMGRMFEKGLRMGTGQADVKSYNRRLLMPMRAMASSPRLRAASQMSRSGGVLRKKKAWLSDIFKRLILPSLTIHRLLQRRRAI